MASLILSTALGATPLGPVGSVIGGIVGGIIDQRVFGELLSEEPEPLENLRVTTNAEGQKAPWGVGPECRVPGAVIFAGPLRAREVEQEGKGGKAGATTFEYRIDVGVAVMRKAVTGGLLRLWANGELIYDADSDVNINGDDISAASVRLGSFDYSTNPPTLVFDNYIDVSAPAGGTDLGQLRSGFDCDVSGFVNSANNGTDLRVVSSFRDVDGTSGARIFLNRDGTPGVDESAGASVTITQLLDPFGEAAADDIITYDGNDAQDVDPTMDAAFDDGGSSPFVPAHRGTTWVMCQGLNVTKWGATVPRFTALVAERSTASVEDAINELVDRTELLDSSVDVDASALSGLTHRGIVQLGPTAPGRGIRELMYVNYAEAQNRDGVLTFFERPTPPEVAVSESLLAAREAGSSTPTPLQEIRESGVRLPQELNVTFVDRNRDWQEGNRTFRRVANPLNNRLRQSFTVTMDGLQAKRLAKRRLIASHVNARRVELTLPPSEFGLLPSDVLNVTVGSEPYRVLVAQVDRGANELMRVQGVIEHSDVWTLEDHTDAVPEGYFDSEVSLPAELQQFVLDIPPLDDEQATRVGLLFATSTQDPGAAFGGGSVFRSTDGGVSYNQLFGIGVESKTGVALEALGGSVNPDHWDRVNTLLVELDDNDDALTSATELEALAGARDLLVGREIVGFVTADNTGLGPRQWRISQLLRGRRNTEAFIDSHAADERVVDLNGATRFHELGASAFMVTSEYKIVPFGRGIDFVTPQSVLHAAESSKPWSPYAPRLRRHSGNSLVISFQRRTRLDYRSLGMALPPLEETQERYEVEIFDPGDLNTVVRTLSVAAPFVDDDETGEGGGTPADPLPDGQPFFIYTGSDIASDFSSGETDIVFRVYQLGDLVGRGRFLQFNSSQWF